MSKIDFSRVVTAEALAAEQLGAARRGAEAQLLALIEAASVEVSGAVPLAEKLMWASKEEAARACLAQIADAGQMALLAAEAEMTGEPVAALAARILDKAEAMQARVSRLVGIRRKAMVALADAKDASALALAVEEAVALIEAVA